VAFQIGIPGDRALAGDWNGDGIDTIALFRPSVGVLFVTNRWRPWRVDLLRGRFEASCTDEPLTRWAGEP
jgi:hypothetical protein